MGAHGAFLDKKRSGVPITMLTAYDYPTALAQDAAGLDVILVGDSVGTNVLGYQSEREVTLADIVHHTKAVRRGTRRAYVLSDLPFATYDTPDQALASARELVASGADGVKLEGALPDIVAPLVEAGIEVCGHLGLQPQTQTEKRVQGRTAEAARRLLAESLTVEQAGATMLVLELVPEEVAAAITRRLAIPTIGIGAGRHVDGQVLVVPDVLGITEREFRHNRRYGEGGG